MAVAPVHPGEAEQAIASFAARLIAMTQEAETLATWAASTLTEANRNDPEPILIAEMGTDENGQRYALSWTTNQLTRMQDMFKIADDFAKFMRAGTDPPIKRLQRVARPALGVPGR